MGRYDKSTTSAEIYTPTYVKNIVASLGLKYSHETETQINMTCPFHNDQVPSFTINTTTGQYYCFNASCGAVGGLIDFVIKFGKMNNFEALRFMSKCKPNTNDAFLDSLTDLLEVAEDFEPFDSTILAKLSDGLSDRAIKYMEGRGIREETLRYFNVGYSSKMDMVALPLYSHTNIPVGIIGRSVEGKRFKYSPNLPISKVWFNLNRARKTSNTIIVVEASFDALKIHQAGFPNVMAILGSQISEYKMNLINQYFDRLIIMTDSDGKKQYRGCRAVTCRNGCIGHDPGRDSGMKLANGFAREVLWAAMDANTIYPNGAKDPGELTENEISLVINNALPDFEYRQMFE